MICGGDLCYKNKLYYSVIKTNQALLHKREYYEGLNRLRFKADTGYTEGTRTVSPSYGFII